MHTLVIDIGGTNVKVWKTGETDRHKIPSGKELQPQQLVDQVKQVATGWAFDRVSIGYPGQVVNGHPATDCLNLGPGWKDFDYAGAFGVAVRIQNDASMQALGSYEGGKMLYLGLGTGIGSSFISDGIIIPLAIGHLKFYKGEDFNHYLSRKGLELHGPKAWRRAVADASAVLKEAFFADYVVLGGGNAKKVEELPKDCRRGSNQNAYFGGLRMWEDASKLAAPTVLAIAQEPAAADAPEEIEPKILTTAAMGI